MSWKYNVYPYCFVLYRVIHFEFVAPLPLQLYQLRQHNHFIQMILKWIPSLSYQHVKRCRWSERWLVHVHVNVSFFKWICWLVNVILEFEVKQTWVREESAYVVDNEAIAKREWIETKIICAICIASLSWEFQRILRTLQGYSDLTFLSLVVLSQKHIYIWDLEEEFYEFQMMQNVFWTLL